MGTEAKDKKDKKKNKINRKADWFAKYLGITNIKDARNRKHDNQSEAREELNRQMGKNDKGLEIKRKKKKESKKD